MVNPFAVGRKKPLSLKCNVFTCTPKIPKMMKKVQQIRTMLPIGFNEESNVWTTSFKPGALLITLKGLRALTSLNTRRIPKIFEVCPKMMTMLVSIKDTMTRVPSMMFQPDLKYACSPYNSPVETA